MRIVTNEIENTGGNCMVMFLTVEDGGELKQIGIDGETIVGMSVDYYNEDDWYADGDRQLWLTDDWKELETIVGIEFATEIKQKFTGKWQYDSYIKNGGNEQ